MAKPISNGRSAPPTARAAAGMAIPETEARRAHSPPARVRQERRSALPTSMRRDIAETQSLIRRAKSVSAQTAPIAPASICSAPSTDAAARKRPAPRRSAKRVNASAESGIGSSSASQPSSMALSSADETRPARTSTIRLSSSGSPAGAASSSPASASRHQASLISPNIASRVAATMEPKRSSSAQSKASAGRRSRGA